VCVPITLLEALSGKRRKVINTQIPPSAKKQPSFATQSIRKRPTLVL
jgi:hypothetical protein